MHRNNKNDFVLKSDHKIHLYVENRTNKIKIKVMNYNKRIIKITFKYQGSFSVNIFNKVIEDKYVPNYVLSIKYLLIEYESHLIF